MNIKFSLSLFFTLLYLIIIIGDTEGGRATTTIRDGKPNWTDSGGRPPEGLRPGMAEIKRAAAQSAKLCIRRCKNHNQTPPNKNRSKKTHFYKFVVQEKNNLLIVALGDSLTAGYGVEESLSFPGRLQKKLEEKGLPHRVVNAGVSGDTTAGGLRRIHGILKQKPDIVILALGSNDGLRGFPPAEIKKNLDAIIKICLKNKTMVLLAGMKIPPNYGPKYTGEFKAIYHWLAKKYDLPFIPFLLEGVAGKRGLNQPDGIHPKAKGYAIVTELVWQALLPMLE